MKGCEYGCGQKAKYQLKNGKWCCSEKFNSCPEVRKKNSESNKLKQSGKNNGMYGRKHSVESKRKNSESNKKAWANPNSTFNNKTYRRNLKNALIKAGKKRRRTIEYIKENYTVFYNMEKMRYNPDKPKENEIQVHCANHNCKNSKELGGWFTPTGSQFHERIRALEIEGLDNDRFYCSDECKNTCPIYRLHYDPNKEETNKPYTASEYQQFREFVLKRDNYECQYCGEKATDVHHERPQKLEPFFALDPDLAWSVCKKCHNYYGHKKNTNCSTGILSTIVCNPSMGE
jgi:5-methylcytosine-specific restriction endonuclease McrA